MMSVQYNWELEAYETEAKERWGKTDAFQEHAEKTKHYSEQKWNDLSEGLDQIMAEFARCMRNGEVSDSANAQHLVTMLQNYITAHCYTCTNQILAGLGQMYVADERFRNNIDRHADGTASFINEAIAYHCGK